VAKAFLFVILQHKKTKTQRPRYPRQIQTHTEQAPVPLIQQSPVVNFSHDQSQAREDGNGIVVQGMPMVKGGEKRKVKSKQDAPA